MTPIELSTLTLGIACPMANEGPEGVRFAQEVLAKCRMFREVIFFAVFDRATTDNSYELMQALAESDVRVRPVWAEESRCVVDAYVRGYQGALDAHCDWILEIDAGFSHQPDDIPQFFEAMRLGYDCVFGSRFLKPRGFRSTSLKRYFVSRGGTFLANLLLGTRQSDMTSGLELFTRATLQMILDRRIRSTAHFFQTEIKVYCRNLRFVEVPIVYSTPSPRLGSGAVFDAFQQLWRLFRLRLAGRL
jgi:dolichol-phosphate mannosyltransferase